jgi:hypothetical protein
MTIIVQCLANVALVHLRSFDLDLLLPLQLRLRDLIVTHLALHHELPLALVELSHQSRGVPALTDQCISYEV